MPLTQASALTLLWTWLLVALGVDWFSGEILSNLLGTTEVIARPTVLSQFLIWAYATRNVLALVFLVLALALPVGAAAGGLAAYGPQFIRAVLERTVELSGALPSLIIVGLVRLGTGGSSIFTLGLILAALSAIEVSRLVSEETTRLNRSTYVLAARALGGSKRHIFSFHILPRLLPQLGVKSVIVTGSVVLLEAALSYVGLGISVAAGQKSPQHSVTWGSLLGDIARTPEALELSEVLACGSILATALALYCIGARGGPLTDAAQTAE